MKMKQDINIIDDELIELKPYKYLLLNFCVYIVFKLLSMC